MIIIININANINVIFSKKNFTLNKSILKLVILEKNKNN